MQKLLHPDAGGQASYLPITTLFSGPDPTLHKPILSWINEVRANIHSLSCSSHDLTTLAQMANVFSDAIMIFIALDQFQTAREICYSQIQLFLKWARQTKQWQLLTHTFLPWLHLIRIDRLSKNYYAALTKIQALHNTSAAIKLDSLPNEDIKIYSSIEYIQIGLMLRRFNDLDHYIQHQQNISNSDKNILYEGKFLSLIHSGQYQAANHYLAMLQPLLGPEISYVFKLRAAELDLITGNPYGARHSRDLYFHAMDLANFATVKDVLFILHVIQVLQGFQLVTEALELAYACLIAARKLNDDWLLAESLIMLARLVNTKKEKAVADAMIKHYCQTQYAGARKNLLLCYPDLKYVEKRNCESEAVSLFEELLTLSHCY